MRGFLLFALAAFFWITPCAAKFHLEIFVAPEGSDLGLGSREEPLRTLEGARKRVRILRDFFAWKDDITVNFRKGRYPFSKSVLFASEDSAPDSGKTIYRAYQNEEVIFTAAQIIRDWRPHDLAKNIYRAYVGPEVFRQLYVEGESAVRARYPKRSGASDMGPYLETLGADLQAKTFLLSPEDWRKVPLAARHKGLELVVQPHFIHQNLRFARFEESPQGIIFYPQTPEQARAFKKPLEAYTGAAFHFENAYEFIDSPREWFHDPESGYLYYKAAAGESVEELRIELPRIPTIVEIKGSVQDPVRNIEFHGLHFEGSNWQSPSLIGLVASQMVQPYEEARSYENPHIPGAIVRAWNAYRIAFRGNTFRKLGAQAIQFYANVDESDIEGNTFTNIAANALEIDTHALRKAPPEMKSLNVAIWNNDFSKLGRSYSNGGALLAHNVEGLIFEHNHVRDFPYIGIQIGNQPGGRGENIDLGCINNRVRFNHIHHGMQLHDDGGAIYTLGGRQSGTLIEENYIHHILRSRWAMSAIVAGVYLDNHTDEVRVRNNAIAITTTYTKANANTGPHNVFENNISDNPSVIANAGIQEGYYPRACGDALAKK
jgi:hypothetical protein